MALVLWDAVMKRPAQRRWNRTVQTATHQLEQIGGRHDADNVAALDHDQAADRVAPHDIRCTADRRRGRDGHDLPGHQIGDSVKLSCASTFDFVDVTSGQEANNAAGLSDDEMMTGGSA